MSDVKPKTARSYRASVVGDNTIISLNIKWLIQVLVAVAAVVYGYLQIENRIGELERGMGFANEEIADLVSKHIEEEDARYLEMEKQLQWYQKELNLNPLSWGKRKKKKCLYHFIVLNVTSLSLLCKADYAMNVKK